MRRRWALAGAAALVGLAILAAAPNYLDVQRSADADRFRSLLDEYGEFRLASAAVLDFAFAVLYAATVVAVVGGRPQARLGVGLVVLGAIFDEVENAFVLRGALGADSLSDGAVDWMRRFGTLKSISLILGVALVIVGVVRARREPGGDPAVA
ncbi:MAG: hypothetical protein AAGA90_19810 [Actinomycetota bacterium]